MKDLSTITIVGKDIQIEKKTINVVYHQQKVKLF